MKKYNCAGLFTTIKLWAGCILLGKKAPKPQKRRVIRITHREGYGYLSKMLKQWTRSG